MHYREMVMEMWDLATKAWKEQGRGRLTQEHFGQVLTWVGEWEKPASSAGEKRTTAKRWLTKAPWSQKSRRLPSEDQAALTTAMARAFLFCCPTVDMVSLCLVYCEAGGVEFLPGDFVFVDLGSWTDVAWDTEPVELAGMLQLRLGRVKLAEAVSAIEAGEDFFRDLAFFGALDADMLGWLFQPNEERFVAPVGFERLGLPATKTNQATNLGLKQKELELETKLGLELLRSNWSKHHRQQALTTTAAAYSGSTAEMNSQTSYEAFTDLKHALEAIENIDGASRLVLETDQAVLTKWNHIADKKYEPSYRTSHWFKKLEKHLAKKFGHYASLPKV